MLVQNSKSDKPARPFTFIDRFEDFRIGWINIFVSVKRNFNISIEEMRSMEFKEFFAMVHEVHRVDPKPDGITDVK